MTVNLSVESRLILSGERTMYSRLTFKKQERNHLRGILKKLSGRESRFHRDVNHVKESITATRYNYDWEYAE